MATKQRKKIGMMPCEGQRCESHTMGRLVTVYESGTGTLGYHCDICERSPYAKKGTGQHAEWVGDMVPLPRKPEAASVLPVVASQEDATESTPPTVIEKIAKGFSLGALK